MSVSVTRFVGNALGKGGTRSLSSRCNSDNAESVPIEGLMAPVREVDERSLHLVDFCLSVVVQVQKWKQREGAYRSFKDVWKDVLEAILVRGLFRA